MTGGGKTTELYKKQSAEAASKPQVYRHASRDPWKSKKPRPTTNVRRSDDSSFKSESDRLPPDRCTFY